MLFKFLKIGTTLHKPKSIWSTFKNAYLRRRNLKKFWLKLNKNKLPNELIVMTDLFIQQCNRYSEWNSCTLIMWPTIGIILVGHVHLPTFI